MAARRTLLTVTTLTLLLGLAQAVDAACHGDCGSDGAVTVDEIITGVNVALGTSVIGQCNAMDASGEGEVTVDELVGAVRNALSGCPMGGLAGPYSASVSFDASHNGIINLEADANGGVTGSLVIVSPHANSRLQQQFSFGFPVNGVPVNVSGSYDGAGGFEVEGSFVDGNDQTVPVVISGTLPGLTGQAPINIYVGSDTFSATVSAGMTPIPSVTPGTTPTPIGHPIVYAAPGEGTLFNDIWVAAADGTGKTDLTNSPDNFDTDPAWSRDGSRIAWSRGSMGSYQIAVMNADGSNQHVITDEEGSDDDEQPAWSPDGQQIVFVDRGGSLVIVQADGSGRHVLLHGSLDINHSQPNWSSDGTRIAFASNRDNPTLHNMDGFELYTVQPDGAGLNRLTNNTTADNFPVWSPDGGSLLFLGQRGFKMNVLRINANGSGEHSVTNSFIGVDAPTWSRDGSLIVYTGFGASPANYGLLAANADGSSEHLVLPVGPSVPDIY